MTPVLVAAGVERTEPDPEMVRIAGSTVVRESLAMVRASSDDPALLVCVLFDGTVTVAGGERALVAIALPELGPAAAFAAERLAEPAPAGAVWIVVCRGGDVLVAAAGGRMVRGGDA